MRLVTLFTGQWADLDLEAVCRKASGFGYDGLELACWGNHMEINKADDAYCASRKKLLDKYRLDNLYFMLIVDPILLSSESFLWKVFDMKVIDGFVHGSARFTTAAGELARKLQSGIVQNYAFLMLTGIVIIIGWLLLSL